ncbi:MAG: DUF937 domain-containing protein [Siculibacillus sp.]|nr:DUF937 domain-containing protein [Siculibacillus sp.]
MFDPTETTRRFLDPSLLTEAASRFGLDRDRARIAAAALGPAIDAALKRRASDPRTLAEIMGWVKPKPDLAAAMPGGEALGRLFGSRELTAAIVDQISRTSGVDRRSLEIMLPIASEAVMGGFADTLKTHPLTEGLATLFEPKPRPAPTLDEILTDNFGTETSRLVGETLKKTPNPVGPSSFFGEVLGEFIRGFNNGGPPIDEEPHPDDEVPPPSEVVGRLFEAGRDAQAEQARALEAIFDRYWKEGPYSAPKDDGGGAG